MSRRMLAFALAACGLVGCTAKPATPRATKTVFRGLPGAASLPAFKTTAEALTKECALDPGAFTEKYVGRPVEVEGAVAPPSTRRADHGFDLRGFASEPDGVPPVNVFCYVEDGQMPAARGLARGQRVRVVGTIVGANRFAVMVMPCTFTEAGPNPPPRVTAEALLAEFAADGAAASAKYGAAALPLRSPGALLNGTVADVLDRETPTGWRRTIVMAGAGGAAVHADCASHWELTAGVKKGDRVTLRVAVGHYDIEAKALGVAFESVEK